MRCNIPAYNMLHRNTAHAMTSALETQMLIQSFSYQITLAIFIFLATTSPAWS